jgi:hypothetical protein
MQWAITTFDQHRRANNSIGKHTDAAPIVDAAKSEDGILFVFDYRYELRDPTFMKGRVLGDTIAGVAAVALFSDQSIADIRRRVRYRSVFYNCVAHCL